MQTAGHDRKMLNRHLHADNSIPPAAARIMVPEPPRRKVDPLHWQRFVRGRSGWFAAATGAGVVVATFFAYRFQGRDYTLRIDAWRGDDCFNIPTSMELEQQTRPLEDMVELEGVAEVVSLTFSARASSDTIVFR